MLPAREPPIPCNTATQLPLGWAGCTHEALRVTLSPATIETGVECGGVGPDLMGRCRVARQKTEFPLLNHEGEPTAPQHFLYFLPLRQGQ
jgi:hypothetical protein